MVDLKAWQKRVYANILSKGWKVTEVNRQLLLTIGEVMELFDSIRKKKGDEGQELADVFIYCLGLAEILGVDLEGEIERKMAINERRTYAEIDGVMVRTSEG